MANGRIVRRTNYGGLGRYSRPSGTSGAWKIGTYVARKYGPSLASSAASAAGRAASAAVNAVKSAFTPKTRARYGSRPYVKRAKNLKQAAKKIQKLETRVAESETTLDYRSRAVTTVTKGSNTRNYESAHYYGANTLAAVMGALPVYDAATNTFTDRSFSVATNSKTVLIPKIENTLEMKNNYDVPIKVCVYIIVPKTDTSTDPAVTMSAGLADVGITAAQSTLWKIRDAPKFNSAWTIKRSVCRILKPGGTMVVNNSVYNVKWDPTSNDTLTFQRKFKNFAFMCTFEACVNEIAHDTTNGNVGYIKGAVDRVFTQRFICKYDGGVHATRVKISDGLATLLDASSLTGMPTIPINQVYKST